ncbi:MAG: ferrous iron transport protein A [Deltaproteobacteria bacterium]|jgi:ferrous iron transport protein A|nr:ferrous iron transport protein A [Deltaproteobacteria bacterium]
MSESSLTTLRRLRKGQKAIIKNITADGEMGRRIRDMGLVPGIQIQCMGRAPLQDPVALRLLGFTLTLRNNEADFIDVQASGA